MTVALARNKAGTGHEEPDSTDLTDLTNSQSKTII
jgi:hypothetical protein